MADVGTRRTALVLGGGGVAGIAWQIGLLTGMCRAGFPIHRADTLIGTSAGASVAALLAAGVSLDRMVEEQSVSSDDQEQWRPFSLVEVGRANRELLTKVNGDLTAARQRIGAYALRTPAPPAETRLASIRRRIRDADWGTRDLRIVATDAASGERIVLSSADGVPLTIAVAASCAVPGTWAPIAIQDRACIDGGVYSLTNADLAAGAERIVIIAPFGWGDDNPVSGHLRAEVDLLERDGAIVTVIVPDENARAAMSDNVLDPSRRSVSLKAGLEQGGSVRDAAGSALNSQVLSA